MCSRYHLDDRNDSYLQWGVSFPVAEVEEKEKIALTSGLDLEYQLNRNLRCS